MSDDQRVPPVRRPRHLLDPNDLQRSHQRSQSSQESLSNVQRWVMSVLAVTTILHLSAGLAIAAVFMDDAKVDARIGLNVIAAIIGVLAVTTILHLSAGLAIAAVFMDDAKVDARIGLNVIAAIIGVLAVSAARLIHQKTLLSPWLLLGVVPGLIGVFFTFR
jgi:hypothetical protein